MSENNFENSKLTEKLNNQSTSGLNDTRNSLNDLNINSNNELRIDSTEQNFIQKKSKKKKNDELINTPTIIINNEKLSKTELNNQNKDCKDDVSNDESGCESLIKKFDSNLCVKDKNYLSKDGNNETNDIKLSKQHSVGSIVSILPSFKSSKQTPCIYDRINIGLDDEMIIESFISSCAKNFFYYILVILTFGLLLVYCEMKPALKIRLTHRKCLLDEATTVILKNNEKEEFVEKILRPDEDGLNEVEYIHFYHKKLKYIWRPERLEFVKLTGLESEKCAVIYSYTSGLTKQEAEDKFSLYGSNVIEINVQPLWKIIYDTLKNPFYVYQAFIVIVWCVQFYYQFAFCVLAFSLISIALQSFETKKQNKLLKEKVQSKNEVTVIRSSSVKKMSSSKLVPGDLLILTKPCFLNCDAVLVDGASCTVNESMLTGECVPITKTSLIHKPDLLYSPKTNKKNTLYCGTEILQVHPKEPNGLVKAVVVRTGYSTAKGELVRAILFPKESNKSLNSDLIKCMQMFLILGLPCMIYTAWIFHLYKVKLFELIILVIDVVTFLIPPLLPSVMTSINVHAQKRLLKKKIFCLNASYINSCGILDVTVFDKTGTLTEDSLDFAGVLPTDSLDKNFLEKFINSKKKQKNLVKEYESQKIIELNETNDEFIDTNFLNQPWKELSNRDLNHLIMTIGCCHSLFFYDGKIEGDVLDLKMFNQLNWKIITDSKQIDEVKKFFHFSTKPERIIQPNLNLPGNEKKKIVFGIIKEFQFESSLQRMLVVAKPIVFTDSLTFNTNTNQPKSLSLGDLSYINKQDKTEEIRKQSTGFINSNFLNNIYSNEKKFSFNSFYNQNYLVLIKGSPEKIISFCKTETIPKNYDEILSYYTLQGLRVIACASKTIQIPNLEFLKTCQITDFENNLNFDGFVIFNNKLKKETRPTILELKNIDIRCLMATGDNLLTGVNVARNCGLINNDEIIIQLKVDLIDEVSNISNYFINKNEYVEYVKSDQINLQKHLKITYKVIPQLAKEGNNFSNFETDQLIRNDDKNDFIVEVSENVKRARNNSLNWLRKKFSKNGLHSFMTDIENDSDLKNKFKLCCEGPSFQILKYHNQKLFDFLTHKGIVFARMLPNQKQQLIISLQNHDHIVGMVGDGANDCAALRNANCGLSLSTAESAVAAPFSTSQNNISVFKFLICEGKATISATFGAFKYQVSYCFVLLLAVLICFWNGILFSDGEYILVDIILNVAPPLVFGTTAASYKLVARRPNKILFGFSTLFSIFSFIILQSFFYFFARSLIIQQDWYEPYIVNPNQIKNSSPSYLSTAIVSINMMSYVTSAIIFSPGPPFRKSIFSNKIYMAVVLVNLTIVILITFYPSPVFILNYINFKPIPDIKFKFYLLLINILNFFISYLWEVIFLQNIVQKFDKQLSKIKFRTKIPFYEKIEHELNINNWPPILFNTKIEQDL